MAPANDKLVDYRRRHQRMSKGQSISWTSSSHSCSCKRKATLQALLRNMDLPSIHMLQHSGAPQKGMAGVINSELKKPRHNNWFTTDPTIHFGTWLIDNYVHPAGQCLSTTLRSSRSINFDQAYTNVYRMLFNMGLHFPCYYRFASAKGKPRRIASFDNMVISNQLISLLP